MNQSLVLNLSFESRQDLPDFIIAEILGNIPAKPSGQLFL